ncbi:MAG: murein L,D-transpeptidase catalytic domain family protein [Flavobacteriales bacterium]|nr:murein L,D-transpeptidase catalytic domain family protein [Flavobacteriales bacterium]
MKLQFSILIVTLLMLGSFATASNPSKLEAEVALSSIYGQLVGASKPEFSLFEKAYLGYIDLKLSGLLPFSKNILSIIDFRIPSQKKRMWVIDLKLKTILHHTYVAHGENSGGKYAIDFSNTVGSHQSSLGFYITQETYIGKNGLSLRLQGLEHGFNSNARERYVVLHGADYATEEYLKKNGELGNSEGCPAIPMGLHIPIIELTKEGTCLFMYFPDAKYLENSSLILDDF